MAFKFDLKPTATPTVLTKQRSELYGTGLTQKLGEQATRIETKSAEQSLNILERIKAKRAAEDELGKEAKLSVTVLNVKVPDNLELDKWQDEAVQGALKHKHFCLIGAAGTGKTTTLKRIVNAILQSLPEIDIAKTKRPPKQITPSADPIEQNAEAQTDKLVGAKAYAIAFVGFTGRSVQQIKRSLDPKFHPTCATGHATLGYYPETFVDDCGAEGFKERMRFVPYFTANNKLPYDVIVFDEGSMFPILLWNQIYVASKPGCRFICVGDLNQLPPVMDRPILPFFMLNFPTFELKTIHRQALENPIIANSQRILRGEIPVPSPKGFFIKGLDDGSIRASEQILETVKLLHKHGKFDPMRDALIVPMNKEILGQVYLNQHLVNYFNPPQTVDGVVINRRWPIKAARQTIMLAIKDKIMLLQNDNELQLTNGQIGVVVDITNNGSFRDDKLGVHQAHDISMSQEDVEKFMLKLQNSEGEDVEEETDDKEKEKDDKQRQASHITTVKFSTVDGEREIKLSTVGQYGKIAHAYAFTCHKAQGGEYPNVIVAFHSAARNMLKREWLYTAVTRAQQNVYLLCNDKAMRDCLKRQSIVGKTLEEKSKSFLSQINSTSMEQPLLPKAELL